MKLAPGELRTGIAITLKRGRMIAIRVNDPAKILPATARKQAGNELAIHIAGATGVVRRVPILGQDASGRDHGIVIPYNTAHKI